MLSFGAQISPMLFLIPAFTFKVFGQDGYCVTCPTADFTSLVNISYNANPVYTLITTSGCPPYDWSLQNSTYPACKIVETYLIPKTPIPLETPIEIGKNNPIVGPIGIFLNGVRIFSPATGSAENAVLNEKQRLDDCLTVVSPNGWHHGRALLVEDEGWVWSYSARCGLPQDSLPVTHSPLLGMLFDGYGLYGQYNGYPYSLIPLDDCNGHTHLIDDQDTYHYHITKTYPYTIDCYHGCPQITNFREEQLSHVTNSEFCEFVAPEETDSTLGGIFDQKPTEGDATTSQGRKVCVIGWSHIYGITCNILTGIILVICIFAFVIVMCVGCGIVYGEKRPRKEMVNDDEEQPMFSIPRRQIYQM